MNGLERLKHIADTVGFDDHDINVMYKMFVLLYADDTVIFAESPETLQTALNNLRDYCNLWDLKVNASKTKVVVFFQRENKKLTIFSVRQLQTRYYI